MGIVIRQSFWGLVFGYLGVLIGFANAVILMPKFMTPEEIGIWRTLSSMAAFLTPLVLMGTPSSLGRFLPNHESVNRSAIISTLLALTGLAYLMVMSFGLVFKEEITSYYAENMAELDAYFIYLLALLLSNVVYTFMESVSRANFDITTPNFVREVIYKITHLLIIILFGLGKLTFDEYLNAQLAIYFFMILSLIPFLIIRQKVRLALPSRISGVLFKELMTYSGFALLNGLGMAFLIQVDKLVVAKYLGMQDVAVYTTAIYMTTVISMPSKYIGQITTPIITRLFANRSIEEINQNYKASAINQLLLSSFVFLLIYINVQQIFDLMPNGNYYRAGATIVFLIGISKTIENGFGLNGVILNLSSQFRLTSIFIVLMGLLNLGLMILFVPKFGIEGAAYATMISAVIFNVLKYLPLKIRYGLEPFSHKIIGTTVFIISILVIQEHVDLGVINPVVSLLLKSGALSLIFFLFIILYRPSAEMLRMIQEIRHLITNKLKK